MHCNCTGNAKGIRYYWIKDDVQIVSNSSVHTIPIVAKHDNGNYKCKAVKENRYKFSRSIQLNVACKLFSDFTISKIANIIE